MIRGTTLFTAGLAITQNSNKFFAGNGASECAYWLVQHTCSGGRLP